MDYTSLFLSQSYADAWDDYQRSLTRDNFVHWNYIILTASNKQQARWFELQIAERKKRGFLPQKTKFAVIPDKNDTRVGSGGATLSTVRYIAKSIGKNDFSGLRILVIHSGGDSKRIPQYSAIGKLFSPVPHELPNKKSATLFDELMILMSSVPTRISEGMLLLSGDVLLLFNPLQINYSGDGATVISFKEKADIGKNHGVFVSNGSGLVTKFLHKQSVESLYKEGAVDDHGFINIDTGAVILSPKILKSLYSIVSTEDDYDKYVNDVVRLSLYADFIYPLAAESTLEHYYAEVPEGEFCEELHEARTLIWSILRQYRLKVLNCTPAKFIHFGTTGEIMRLMSSGIENYKELGWCKQVSSSIMDDTAGYNSVLSDKVSIGKNCYLESAYVHGNSKIGDNVLLSYINICDAIIPSDVVFHGLKQKNGKFVARIYGINDNPKENKLFGKDIRDFLKQNNISRDDLGDNFDGTLWNADLYPLCNNIGQAVSAALNLYKMFQGNGNVNIWKKSIRKSLCSSFNDADQPAIISWENRMRELVQINKVTNLISRNVPLSEIKSDFDKTGLTSHQTQWLKTKLKQTDFSETVRLYYYLGTLLGGSHGEQFITECFNTISKSVLAGAENDLRYSKDCKIVKNRHTVNLPLRVNWGGGWSDTPPYCNENGGTVLNAAILLNGKKPVEVTLEKISEYKIVFDSRDMDVHGEFDNIENLQSTGNPYDPFALQKAALVVCGIIPKDGGNLYDILNRLGGGFVMHSEVTNVPKGSGLGTSSILSAACVKALLDFVGIDYSEDDIYQYVLQMEQIMSTGGGWQDQVGGLVPGIKYITSKPGLKQNIKIEHVNVTEKTKSKLNDRFVIIYTGQRRLARNLLREVIGRYIGNEERTIYALNEIKRIAMLMRSELENGNIDEFANLMNRHWELSKEVDKSSTNMLIDRIFESIDDLISGKLVCGAGGGGFLQVILKEKVSKEDVRERLKSVFPNTDIDVWDCTVL